LAQHGSKLASQLEDMVTQPDLMSRRLSVLGSTGSVGCNTLDLIARCRAGAADESENVFPLEALTAHRNVELLIEQARTFRPKTAVIGDEKHYQTLKDGLAGTSVKAASGDAAIVEAAEQPADWVMSAIVGAAGLKPTVAAIRRGAMVALANKECLVCAGPLLMDLVHKSNATLLPVDSEHNAIFQVLETDQPEAVEMLILTASGGPFREWTAEAMSQATPEQAVNHPNWNMGAKISVDSATMMNKGLELIEAAYLFDMPAERIGVLVHPQSVVHSLVQYIDGSVLAQLGSPDMRIPIASTLGWPHRIATPAQRLDLGEIAKLTFETPDLGRFPALSIARQSLQTGGGTPTILNAANEIAVRGFLDRRLGFLDIAAVVQATIERTCHTAGKASFGSLEDVEYLDGLARREAEQLVRDYVGQ